MLAFHARSQLGLARGVELRVFGREDEHVVDADEDGDDARDQGRRREDVLGLRGLLDAAELDVEEEPGARRDDGPVVVQAVRLAEGPASY